MGKIPGALIGLFLCELLGFFFNRWGWDLLAADKTYLVTQNPVAFYLWFVAAGVFMVATLCMIVILGKGDDDEDDLV